MRLVIRFVIIAAVALCCATPVYTKDQSGSLPAADPALLQSDSSWQFLPLYSRLWAEFLTAELFTQFTTRGVLGDGRERYLDHPSSQFSFETPPGTGLDYLFLGGLWIGGIVDGDTLVSATHDGWIARQEFAPSDWHGSMQPVSGYADRSFRAEFLDTGVVDQHTPMHLRVSMRGHSWQDPPFDKTVLYDVVVTNIGASPVSSGYVGVLLDHDVYFERGVGAGYYDDMSGSIPGRGIAFGCDDDGDPINGVKDPQQSPTRSIAMKFIATYPPLADTNFNWWSSGPEPCYDLGPRRCATLLDPYRDFGTGGTGTPATDADKYYILSHDEWDFDSWMWITHDSTDTMWCDYSTPTICHPLYANDYRMLLSAGPFDLAPDSSVRFLFALFTGDSVTANAEIDYANWNPYTYDSSLYLEDLVEVADWSDSLADSLLNPLLPTLGLGQQWRRNDTVMIQWDPWVYPEVEGYNIYVAEVPPDSLPYPGVAPPWFTPDTWPLLAEVGQTFRYPLTGLRQDRIYAVRVAHRTATAVGAMSQSFFVYPNEVPVPGIAREYAFLGTDHLVDLSWIAPESSSVDHYNVYRFPAGVSNHYFAPFIDTADLSADFNLAETFTVGGTDYHLYAVPVYASVAADLLEYSDTLTADSAIYGVTAVNPAGFESGIAQHVVGYPLGHKTKDILVVTEGGGSGMRGVTIDSITNFYSSMLQGYDIDIMTAWGTTIPARDWRTYIPYRLVIFDDHLIDDFSVLRAESVTKILSHYLLSGGQMAYFGQFGSFVFNTGPHGWIGEDVFTVEAQKYFAIDSVFSRSISTHPTLNPPVTQDTLIGLILSESVMPGFPDVAFDTVRNPFYPIIANYWPLGTAPAPAVLIPDVRGEVTHRFRSKYPLTSIAEGAPIGIRNTSLGMTTYAFGFHLWYMEPDDARALIDAMMELIPTDVPSDERPSQPMQFALSQNYPNPFNPTTTIEFTLPQKAKVTIEIFNIIGQKVRTLLSEERAAGSHKVVWDGTDSHGTAVASGIYLYRLTTGEQSTVKKMVLMK